MTEYVVTRWYRAPEIMCSCESYDYKIDVWSTGCIFAELLMRNPIFPGEDYKQQLHLIFNILGTPTEDDFNCISNEFAAQYIRNLPVREKVPLAKVIGKRVNPLAVDLLEKMLVFDPNKRISVDEALEHPYLASLHDPKIEIVAPTTWSHDFERDLQDKQLTQEALTKYFYKEIHQYRPHLVLHNNSIISVVPSTTKLQPVAVTAATTAAAASDDGTNACESTKQTNV
uniref:Mitogen-activated protein kinase FUS3 n=1 Tax=Lygus hesperus TaxID=30085 RepID=A0A0A9Z9Z1_LYGHE